MLGPTAHIDTFSRENLPKQSRQPNFLLDEYNYPDYLNASEELTEETESKKSNVQKTCNYCCCSNDVHRYIHQLWRQAKD